MSTEQAEANVKSIGAVIELDPDDILIPEESNVRPWSTKRGDDEAELEDLARLGQSIADNGQIQPIVVTTNSTLGGPRYSLIAGRRRTKAVKMYNMAADEPIKLRAVLDHGVKQDKTRANVMFKHALHENVQRKDLNPMDFAANIQFVREKMKAGKDAKGTQKVADFFRCSPAQIIQHEKLLSLPEDIQRLVSVGEMSLDAAFVVEKQVPEKRAEVVERAREMQKEEESEPDTASADAAPTAPKKRKARKTPAIKAKHVRAAVREVTGEGTKRSRTEILDFFSSQLGPTNGYPNGDIHQFCEGVSLWADGKLTDKKLNSLWDKLVSKAERGTPPPPKTIAKAEARTLQVAPGRKGTAGKPAPKKKAKRTSKKK